MKNRKPVSKLFDGYTPWAGFDEMFESDGSVRPCCSSLLRAFQGLSQKDFEERKASSDMYFLRQGITFNVYHDEKGTERIFPFDMLPRIIPAMFRKQI